MPNGVYIKYQGSGDVIAPLDARDYGLKGLGATRRPVVLTKTRGQ